MNNTESSHPLNKLIGQSLGSSDWITLTQEQINQFADVTADHQGIHIDPEKAQAAGFDTTIAHGMLTFSRAIPALVEILGQHIEEKTTINYGCNSVRYLTPVPSGSAIRIHIKLLDTKTKGAGQLVTLETTVELKEHEKPALIAEALMFIF